MKTEYWIQAPRPPHEEIQCADLAEVEELLNGREGWRVWKREATPPEFIDPGQGDVWAEWERCPELESGGSTGR